jgi:hypothetical protein
MGVAEGPLGQRPPEPAGVCKVQVPTLFAAGCRLLVVK